MKALQSGNKSIGLRFPTHSTVGSALNSSRVFTLSSQPSAHAKCNGVYEPNLSEHGRDIDLGFLDRKVQSGSSNEIRIETGTSGFNMECSGVYPETSFLAQAGILISDIST